MGGWGVGGLGGWEVGRLGGWEVGRLRWLRWVVAVGGCGGWLRWVVAVGGCGGWLRWVVAVLVEVEGGGTSRANVRACVAHETGSGPGEWRFVRDTGAIRTLVWVVGGVFCDHQ